MSTYTVSWCLWEVPRGATSTATCFSAGVSPDPVPCPVRRASTPLTPLLVYLRGLLPSLGFCLPTPAGEIPRVLGLAGPVRALTAAAGWGAGVGVCTGAPALFVIPWVIVRYLYENTQ